MQAEIDKTKQFVMPNTQKTAVEILWQLDTPVREDIYTWSEGCENRRNP